MKNQRTERPIRKITVPQEDFWDLVYEMPVKHGIKTELEYSSSVGFWCKVHHNGALIYLIPDRR